MYLHLNTVLEEVVDPLSIDYHKNKNQFNDNRQTGVLKNLQSKSYLLGVLYFTKYLNPSLTKSSLDELLSVQALDEYKGHDFNSLHADLERATDIMQLDFLKGVWYAYGFL